MLHINFCRAQRILLGALLFTFVAMVSVQSFAAGFGADDRVARVREKGTLYGAIGLVVHSDGL